MKCVLSQTRTLRGYRQVFRGSQRNGRNFSNKAVVVTPETSVLRLLGSLAPPHLPPSNGDDGGKEIVHHLLVQY